MKWTELLQLSGFQSLHEIAQAPTQIAANVFLLSTDTYAYVVPHNERLEGDAPGAPFATMAVWAESPGSARRALLLEIQADAPERGKNPPVELLLAGSRGAYGDLAAAATRTGRRLEYGVYRGVEHDPTERPYAIALRF